jgi:diaminopimelate epimerase
MPDNSGMTRLKFTKMQGAGNDFVMLDGVRQKVSLTPRQWQFLADRHFGVGADQMLLVEPASRPDVDFRYRIFNANGGEVEQCGNGSRCFVRFVLDQGLTDKTTIRVETMNGIIEPSVLADGSVRVDMGPPRLELADIPFVDHGLSAMRVGGDTAWQIAGHWLSVVSMGNPHALILVDDVDTFPVETLGPQIQASSAFPAGVNVGFLQVQSRRAARLRVFERGVGETLACGTGACAAMVAGVRRGLLDADVHLQARGGDLRLEWDASVPGASVFLSGPATVVFSGEIDLPDL